MSREAQRIARRNRNRVLRERRRNRACVVPVEIQAIDVEVALARGLIDDDASRDRAKLGALVGSAFRAWIDAIARDR